MVRTITTIALKDMFDRKERYTLVNVLDKADYVKEHICGSINIPYAEIEKTAPIKLNKDDLIITHCTGPTCKASLEIAEKLLALGYKNVLRYEGGMAEWKAAGYCLETKTGKSKKAA